MRLDPRARLVVVDVWREQRVERGPVDVSRQVVRSSSSDGSIKSIHLGRRPRRRGYPGASRMLSDRRSWRCRVAFVRRQEPLGVERGHTARAGGGDRLPVRVVLHIPGGKDAQERSSRSCPAS